MFLDDRDCDIMSKTNSSTHEVLNKRKRSYIITPICLRSDLSFFALLFKGTLTSAKVKVLSVMLLLFLPYVQK